MRDICDKTLLPLKSAFQPGNHAIERICQAPNLVVGQNRINAPGKFAPGNSPAGALNFNKWTQGHPYQRERQSDGQADCPDNSQKEHPVKRYEEIVDRSRRSTDFQDAHSTKVVHQRDKKHKLAHPILIRCYHIGTRRTRDLLNLVRRKADGRGPRKERRCRIRDEDPTAIGRENYRVGTWASKRLDQRGRSGNKIRWEGTRLVENATQLEWTLIARRSLSSRHSFPSHHHLVSQNRHLIAHKSLLRNAGDDKSQRDQKQREQAP